MIWSFIEGLLIVGGLVSAYIISVYSLAINIDPDDVEELEPGLSRKHRQLLRTLADDPRRFSQVAVLYKSFVLIAVTFFALDLLPEAVLGGQWRALIAAFLLAGTWLVYLLVVEYLPRKSSMEAVGPGMIRYLWLLSIVYRLFSPLLILYRGAMERATRDKKISEDDKEEIVERAIETLADEAGIAETIVEADEKEMIGQIFQLDQTVVKEIMIPRMDVTAIEKSMSFQEIREMVHRDGHSRFPVYVESIDKVIGLLYVKDLFNRMPAPGEEFRITEYLRKPYFVPETKVIGELLTEFKAMRQHIAIVLDEFGGVSGVVTMEDIIEEIFGEIQDEHDWEEDDIIKLPDSRYLVTASLMVEKLQDYFDREFKQTEFDSVGGLIYDLVGSVPDVGQKVKWHDFEFEIKDVEGQRITRVIVRVKPKSNTGS
ncbi:MAG: hemolysin family protein [bacterium]|nr:hemolysin family protein [bacterium]